MKAPTGTREWASSNLNITKGCEHNCRYCYARASALRFKQINNASEWETMSTAKEKVAKDYGKKKGVIMFPTSHDITPTNLDDCLTVLKKVLGAGNNVLIVSKPHLACISELCHKLASYKDNILFRFTIGSLNEPTLKFWEPNAPSPKERLECLKEACMRGFNTSVSAEPLLGLDTFELVETTKPFITDCIWLGGMNQISRRVDASGFDTKENVMLEIAELVQTPVMIRQYYTIYKDDPKVKWKDSFKKILGLETPQEIGLDE